MNVLGRTLDSDGTLNGIRISTLPRCPHCDRLILDHELTLSTNPSVQKDSVPFGLRFACVGRPGVYYPNEIIVKK